jgi:hypothetical protein
MNDRLDFGYITKSLKETVTQTNKWPLPQKPIVVQLQKVL